MCPSMPAWPPRSCADSPLLCVGIRNTGGAGAGVAYAYAEQSHHEGGADGSVAQGGCAGSGAGSADPGRAGGRRAGGPRFPASPSWVLRRQDPDSTRSSGGPRGPHWWSVVVACSQRMRAFMSDLAYTVMIIAVFLGLVLMLRSVQWCFDTTRARRVDSPPRAAASRAPNPGR